MNAVIYARYSSDNQREESIEGQIRERMEFAERQGVTVIGKYGSRTIGSRGTGLYWDKKWFGFGPTGERHLDKCYIRCITTVFFPLLTKMLTFTHTKLSSCYYSKDDFMIYE